MQVHYQLPYISPQVYTNSLKNGNFIDIPFVIFKHVRSFSFENNRDKLRYIEWGHARTK